MTGAGDALTRVYRDGRSSRCWRRRRRAGGHAVRHARRSRARLIEPLTRIETFVEEADRERLRDLTAIVNEKLDLDVHLSLQRALRLWLVTHVPPAMLLLGLLAGAHHRGGVSLMARPSTKAHRARPASKGYVYPAAKADGAVGVARASARSSS